MGRPPPGSSRAASIRRVKQRRFRWIRWVRRSRAALRSMSARPILR